MTRRTVSKIIVILMVLPIAVKAWQKIRSTYFPAVAAPDLIEAPDGPRNAEGDTLTGQQGLEDE